MNDAMKAQLIEISTAVIMQRGNDSSHDSNHALQVLKNAERIAANEGGDLDVLVPAALLHDVVIYPKNDPRSPAAPAESATLAASILTKIPSYPNERIAHVQEVIAGCSFHSTETPATLEGKILCDADKLEATGAISIVRTFSSCGQMGRRFYDPDDPFAENREPDSLAQGLDLCYTRLLIAEDRMYTETARKIAKGRTAFLHVFLDQLRLELA